MNYQNLPNAPTLYQFKNALHFGCFTTAQTLNPHPKTQTNSPSKSMKQSIRRNKGIDKFESQSSPPKGWSGGGGSSRSQITGLGLTIDDQGNILLAEWDENKVRGRFFLFKANISLTQSNFSSFPIGLCQYGYMIDDNLQGQNYIYSINGTIVGGNFERNRLNGKSIIIHNNKKFLNQNQLDYQKEQNQVQIILFKDHNVVASKPNERSTQLKKNPNQSNFVKSQLINHNQVKNAKQKLKFTPKIQKINLNQFINPYKFLCGFKYAGKDVRNKQEKQQNTEQLQRSSFQIFNLTEHEFFVGFVSQAQIFRHNLSNLKGFGIIFRDGWPVKYGKFLNGKLQGLGRIYETQLNVCDGLFVQDRMVQGFIIDFFNKNMYYGYQNSPLHSNVGQKVLTKHQNLQRFRASLQISSQFVITNSYSGIPDNQISNYKKIHHLKSLEYNNTYFNMPRNIYHLQWPPIITSKLYNNKIIQGILEDFQPGVASLDVSEIQRIAECSENRVQRDIILQMKQRKLQKLDSQNPSRVLLRNKSRIISAYIQNTLQSRVKKNIKNDQETQLIPFREFIAQYEQIRKSKRISRLDSSQYQINQKGGQQTLRSYKKDSSSKNDLSSKKQQKSQLSQKDKDKSSKNVEIKIDQFPKTPQKIAKKPQYAIKSQKFSEDSEIKKFKQLIAQYQICETERKKIHQKIKNPKKSMTQSFSSKTVKSKLELMKLDHQDQGSGVRRIQIRQPKTVRGELDLHKIYSQFLHTKEIKK